MKLIINIILIFAFSISAKSQITINFTGHDETNTVTLSKVIVENLSNGQSITLNSGFVVDLVETVKVSELNSDKNVVAYPNPFNSKISLNIYSNFNEKATVSVNDITGKTVIVKNINLKAENNIISFTPAYEGIFIINISSKNIFLSKKVICNSSNSNNFKLEEKNNNISIKKVEKRKANPQLLFHAGDNIRYTGFYSNQITIGTESPTISHYFDFEFHACVDYENNIYPIVKIGTQWWMAKNLQSTKYSDGSNINGNYIYNNNSTNENVYGRLYTWTAVMHGSDGDFNIPGNTLGVCPTGWHVPTEGEWDLLRDDLGGKILMHAKIKETGTLHWNAPNSDATNESGMTVVAGGMRWADVGYQYFGEQAFFWTASDDSSNIDIENASAYTFYYQTTDYYLYKWNPKTAAHSVRCVMD